MLTESNADLMKISVNVVKTNFFWKHLLAATYRQAIKIFITFAVLCGGVKRVAEAISAAWRLRNTTSKKRCSSGDR